MILLTFSVLLVSCTDSEKSCQTHKDCTTATCCHASEAVNKENGPNCAGKLCSMECQSGTIDCGQGKIDCVEGSCQVIMNEQ